MTTVDIHLRVAMAKAGTARTLPADMQFWRVKHDKELGALWRPNMPEVFPMFPNHFSEFGRSWQLLSKAMNPRISGDKWTACYTYKRYMTNNNGFGDETDLRANWVLEDNLSKPNPRVECLTTGGSLLTGYAYSNNGAYIRTDAVIAEPPATVTLKHTVEVFSDGSLKVDGNVIP